MWLAVEGSAGLPEWATQYGLPGIVIAAAGLVIRVLFKQLQDDFKAERARADRLEAQLTRYAEDERKRYGELLEAMKTVGEVLRELRTERRRQ